MVVIIAGVLGAVYGAWRAHKRGGTGFDLAQYSGVYALLFAVVAIFLTVLIAR